jgi:hypothetical protein
MAIPSHLADIPLTDILALLGVTHKRDDKTDNDRCHVLWARDGSEIGRYDAFDCVKHYDEIVILSNR